MKIAEQQERVRVATLRLAYEVPGSPAAAASSTHDAGVLSLREELVADESMPSLATGDLDGDSSALLRGCHAEGRARTAVSIGARTV